jgi:hypothetical protein
MQKQLVASSSLTSWLTPDGRGAGKKICIAATFRCGIGNVRPGYWLITLPLARIRYLSSLL